jgi:hypothetical protein
MYIKGNQDTCKMHMKYMRDTYLSRWQFNVNVNGYVSLDPRGRIHLESIVGALEADDFFDET